MPKNIIIAVYAAIAACAILLAATACAGEQRTDRRDEVALDIFGVPYDSLPAGAKSLVNEDERIAGIDAQRTPTPRVDACEDAAARWLDASDRFTTLYYRADQMEPYERAVRLACGPFSPYYDRLNEAVDLEGWGEEWIDLPPEWKRIIIAKYFPALHYVPLALLP